MQATVTIDRCPDRSMMNLHHELGNAEIEGEQVRFTQDVNGACFWLSVGSDLYQIDTEELMNAVVNAVMKQRHRQKGGQ